MQIVSRVARGFHGGKSGSEPARERRRHGSVADGLKRWIAGQCIAHGRSRTQGNARAHELAPIVAGSLTLAVLTLAARHELRVDVVFR